MNRKQKLGLTWIGKDEQLKPEPRILIEDSKKSHGAKTENMLIYSDNLLGLKALEQQFAGKIKCVYIDPPFNTGAAFEHYDDDLQHSQWLNLMYDRLKLIYTLLSKKGFFIIHLDDAEAAYCKVILDEIFGRNNYLNQIALSANSPFGFKHTSKSVFKTTNYLFLYAKDTNESQIKTLFKPRAYDKAYKFILEDRESNYKKWKWKLVAEVVAENLGYESTATAKKALTLEAFLNKVAEYAIDNSQRVFRTASVTGGALLKRKETIKKSKNERNKVFVHPNDDMPYFFLNGERILFYDERMREIDGKMQPAEVITDMWDDISWEGIAKEGGVDFPKGKKPEKLIHRLLELTTKENDWVLDSFLGSGTTAAVAHKMNRRWIGIELGNHCHTHCIPRLKSVVNGSDQSGISKVIDWKGGGGFRYYYLAPSILKKDKYNNWIIDEKYNANMLAAAMAKHEGFRYCPDSQIYWKQGQSTEKDFIFTTTQFVTVEVLDKIKAEMKNGESLLICAKSFHKICENKYTQITIKKIPQMLLGRCEFGKDNYKLNIIDLPEEDGDDE
jgi:adenine-specific DNA-methyltransferase